ASADPNGFCSTNCSDFHASFTVNGVTLSEVATCGTVDCSSCEERACPAIYCSNQALTPGREETLVWQFVDEPGTCGSGVACRANRCLRPGHYTGRFCARRGAAYDGGCELT